MSNSFKDMIKKIPGSKKLYKYLKMKILKTDNIVMTNNSPVIVTSDSKKKEDEEKKRRKRERRAKKDAGYLAHVVSETGWDEAYAKEMMDRSVKATGTSYEHYSIYRFWELTEDEQKEYFSKGDADKLRKIYNKDKAALKVFMNKDLFCKNFDKYLGRPWMSTENMTLGKFKKSFKNEKKIIYKPRSSSGGRGIEVFELSEDTMNTVYETLRGLPEGIIEGYVNQHPEMKKLSLKSVNTIRVVTIQTKDDLPNVEKNKVHFLYAGVRMGYGNSYVDNLHSGGMIAAINIDTGEVETNAVDFANNVIEVHPDTGVRIKGFKIPYFNEIKTLIESAGKDIPGYFGWDIAITETGPIIIEVNTHPGADGLQTPYIPERKGMRHVIAKYLVEPAAKRKPEKPYGPKISGITKEGIEFYWKKVEVADGYEVFRSYNLKGPYECIAVIEKRSIGTYMDSKFDSKKRKVYYTCRSYINNEDGTRIYSDTVEATVASYRDKMVAEREATYLYSGTQRNIRVFYGWSEVMDAEWSSSDEAIATISPDGTIRAIASGTCTLTCHSKAIKQQVSTQVVVDRKACEPLSEIESRYQFSQKDNCWKNENSSNTNDAVIMMVGDMMCGSGQMKKQYSTEEGWNFNDSYEYVKDVTSNADFAIGNLETLLAAGWPYMLDESYINNKNNCNATSRYLDAVRYGGFDAVTMANNHNCDGGTLALLETIEQVEKYNFAHTGVFGNAADDRFFIADINGIKVGFLAFISERTGFNGKDEEWSAEEKDALLNVFSAEKAKIDIAACKAAGAEYIIAYMHWGFKNHRSVAKHQYEEAQAVADAGADYIVGANPHVLQAYEVIVSSDGRQVPCAYSIGNFQAVMKQVVGNRDSIILRIRLSKEESGKVNLVENGYIPCYTYTECQGSKWAPVSVSENYNVGVTKKSREKIYTRILKTIGDNIAPL